GRCEKPSPPGWRLGRRSKTPLVLSASPPGSRPRRRSPNRSSGRSNDAAWDATRREAGRDFRGNRRWRLSEWSSNYSCQRRASLYDDVSDYLKDSHHENFLFENRLTIVNRLHGGAKQTSKEIAMKLHTFVGSPNGRKVEAL